jgi:hypothetical protein
MEGKGALGGINYKYCPSWTLKVKFSIPENGNHCIQEHNVV